MIAALVICTLFALVVLLIVALLHRESYFQARVSRLTKSANSLRKVIMDKNIKITAHIRRVKELEYLNERLEKDLDISHLHIKNFQGQIDLLTKAGKIPDVRVDLRDIPVSITNARVDLPTDPDAVDPPNPASSLRSATVAALPFNRMMPTRVIVLHANHAPVIPAEAGIQPIVKEQS